jgi:hypothetical protein
VGVRRGERIPLMHLTQISFKGFSERPGGLRFVPDSYRARELFLQGVIALPILTVERTGV